jgi:hypothetical protein
MLAGTARASVGSVDHFVMLRDVAVSPKTISGMLENVSGERVTGVRLMISDRFLWRNEYSPGPDDPSRGYAKTLDIVIAPHGSVPFRIDHLPLPARDDGQFVTTIVPISVDLVDVSVSPAVPREDAARRSVATRP